MRLLIILQHDYPTDTANQVQELTRNLGLLCLPVNITDKFGGLTTDVEVIMSSANSIFNTSQHKLLEQCDLAVCKIPHSTIHTFKVVKDRKKSAVRDITEASFYCMLGKYYAFDYVELTKNDCE